MKNTFEDDTEILQKTVNDLVDVLFRSAKIHFNNKDVLTQHALMIHSSILFCASICGSAARGKPDNSKYIKTIVNSFKKNLINEMKE